MLNLFQHLSLGDETLKQVQGDANQFILLPLIPHQKGKEKSIDVL